MTYQQIVNAKQAIDEIGKLHFPIRISYELFKLKKRVEQLFEFEVDQEKKLVEKYGGQIKNNGSILFDSKEITETFGNEMAELLKTEVEEEFEPVDIDITEAGDVSISPELMWKLDGFVNFM